ncbi:Hypothetical Protein FCC1311_109912 [Hondaea fermentalgiana]|uniref:Tyrosine specific protein phosphatases domain-containing protein n=1 Tax=Hondaea fermentalgiana TaxID=2315210 RepID=A0A2R5GWR2_9STRA|nr:Hypothetical Protein FCC1311_109912 [Hondaea fermentalgiana]|eukprot:GBG34769.1 Hypothetical Protein FCC1311_109912 [Hondaea fermentalgiana]
MEAEPETNATDRDEAELAPAGEGLAGVANLRDVADVAPDLVLPAKLFPLAFKLELAFTWPVRGFSKQVGERLFKDASTLNNLYNIILDNAKKPIQTIFAELAEPNNYPVMIHCVAGKDRTGIIVALLLRVCGVSHEAVVADYARSEGYLAAVLESEDVRGNKELLNPNAIKSPPEALGRALKRVEDRYGSIRRYLQKHMRVPSATIDKVRENIMIDPTYVASAAPRPPVADLQCSTSKTSVAPTKKSRGHAAKSDQDSDEASTPASTSSHNVDAGLDVQ